MPFVGRTGCLACTSRLDIKPEENENLNNSSPTAAQLQTHGGVTVDVLDRVSTYKWLGCLLHAGGCHDADIDFHLQAALRAFNANRWILTDRHVSLATRLRYFNTIITPMACLQVIGRFSKRISTRLTWHSVNCFGAWSAHQLPLTGHGLGMKSCMTGTHGLYNLLTVFGETLVGTFVWKCIGKLAHYAANLPPDRWLARILTWTCRGHQGTGRPRNTWDTMIQKFCRYQHLGIWLDVARDANRWSNLMPHFVTFCAQTGRKRSERHCNVQSVVLFFSFSPVPFTGCLAGIQVSLHFDFGFRANTSAQSSRRDQGQVKPGQLARPNGSPVLGRKQLYTKRNTTELWLETMPGFNRCFLPII